MKETPIVIRPRCCVVSPFYGAKHIIWKKFRMLKICRQHVMVSAQKNEHPAIAYLPSAMSQKPVSICEKSAYVQPMSTVALAAAHPRCVDEDFHQLVDTFRRLMHYMLLDQRCHSISA